ncbi:MAG: DNA mismatch repair endonuclease MutL [Deltaproteobacteria bacterium]|nr:DNA mismatch repair endonuclease MutL [Deltaproteobacteria bacterium]
MGGIRVLTPQIASQIAAGEVITRPAAVVKELIENSLDAGARRISVEIEQGGCRRIRVADDGGGMTREEAPLSLQRHATSKIRTEEDLLCITTLGFRGEALPSIAAVSRLELVTRTAAEAAACRVVVRGGEVEEVSTWAAPVGTQVTVEDLYYNTPARRKFLKSPETEQAYIVETVRGLALGHPEVQFHLRTQARELLAAPAPQNLLERVASLYGPELAGHLLPFHSGGGPWAAAGLISQPDFSVASSRFQVFLVNRRVVQDRLLPAVLKEIYHGRLPKGRYPAAFVSLTLPPDQVDVNVHPAKAEVRFAEAGRVYALLLSALRQGLGPLAGEPRSYAVRWQPEPPPRAQEAGQTDIFLRPLPCLKPASFPPFSPADRLEPRVSHPFRFQDLNIIGQLHRTYILAQGPEGLVVIDQHAAHERVLYEALAREAEGDIRQPLLFPRLVEVPLHQADWVRDNLEALAQAGLVVEPFGGASFLVIEAPVWLQNADLEAMLLEMVETLGPLKGLEESQAVREQVRLIMACHGAIRAGQELHPEEMKGLLARLDELEVSSHCPHGRPLWRLISLAELNASFRRPRR